MSAHYAHSVFHCWRFEIQTFELLLRRFLIFGVLLYSDRKSGVRGHMKEVLSMWFLEAACVRARGGACFCER